MPKKGGNTVQKVWGVAEPIVTGLGLKLWDIRYVKEGADWYLRVFIDKEGGVDINDCEAVSRALDEPLDTNDPIPQAYTLEVSSPGLERPLVRDEHFRQFIGADIMVKMIRPVEGLPKEFKGVLTDFNDGEITVNDHSGENKVTINIKDTAWIKLDDFD